MKGKFSQENFLFSVDCKILSGQAGRRAEYDNFIN